MLSKLIYYETNTCPILSSDGVSVDQSHIKNIYGKDISCIKRLDGGTLGVTFIGNLKGKKRFFKTYSLLSGADRLKNELKIMQKLYNSRLNIEEIYTPDIKGGRLWIAMDELTHSTSDLNPENIKSLVSEYDRFIQYGGLNLNLPLVDITYFIRYAELALSILSMNGLLAKDTIDNIQGRLFSLRDRNYSFPEHICHGDLGPKNIMCDLLGPVAVDWEDAFWGFDGYDSLYWLTFFKNRKYLTAENLNFTQFGLDFEVSVLVMIVLLKCYLSFRDGSYTLHSLSFNDRIGEILIINN